MSLAIVIVIPRNNCGAAALVVVATTLNFGNGDRADDVQQSISAVRGSIAAATSDSYRRDLGHQPAAAGRGAAAASALIRSV